MEFLYLYTLKELPYFASKISGFFFFLLLLLFVYYWVFFAFFKVGIFFLLKLINKNKSLSFENKNENLADSAKESIYFDTFTKFHKNTEIVLSSSTFFFTVLNAIYLNKSLFLINRSFWKVLAMYVEVSKGFICKFFQNNSSQ